jgi:hypothetical protein
MDKKLKLTGLKIQSFVTSLNNGEKQQIRAGDLTTKEYFCSDDACPSDFSYCTCFTECPVNCLPTTRPCL